MKRLKIGLDVDGVLANFVDAFYQEAEKVLGRSIKGTQTTWEFEDSLDISKSEVAQVWKRIKETKNWFLNSLSVLPEVSEHLLGLCLEHDVFFITSRTATAGLPISLQTQMWLDRMGVLFPNVIANMPKGLVASALGLDVFLDDYIKNIKDVSTNSPSTLTIIMNQTYNKDEHGNFDRVNSFPHFIEKIKELSNE